METTRSGNSLSSNSGQLKAAVFCVCLLAFASAEAQLFGGKGLFGRKSEPVPGLTPDQIGIPTPVTGRVEAMKGMEIQFEIQAETKTPAAAVEFLIRTFPSAGKIVSITANPNRRNRAIVTYQADPGSSAETDAFAFAVRYRGGRYSSAMRYDIDLVDLKSEISATKEIDFGEVTIGGEAVKEITVRNLGNGNFQRQVILAPPWYILEPRDGKLNLQGREFKTLKVAFRPDLMGETSYFVSFSRSKEGTTKLIGRGADPFRLVSEQVTLSVNEDSGRREGFVELENPGTKPIRILARASTRLSHSLEEEYFLHPGKVTKIDLALGATDTAPFDGMVQFYLENGYTKSAQIVAPVVPGRLELSIPNSITKELINFGQVSAGKSTERSIVLTNPGGVAVPLEFHVPEPFRLLTDPGPQLAPLGTVNLAIGLFPPPSAKGPVDVTMNVYGNAQTIPIRLMGNVLRGKGSQSPNSNLPPSALPLKGMRMTSGPKASSPPVTTPKETEADPRIGSGVVSGDDKVVIGSKNEIKRFVTRAQEEKAWYHNLDEETLEAMTSPLGHITRPAKNRDVNLEIRRPEDLSIIGTSHDSITLAWTAPKNFNLYDYEVELSGLQVESGLGEPIHVWIPYKNVRYDRIDRLVKAEIERLIPNRTYEFRVFTVDENGRSSAPSDGMYAKTGIPMDWTYIYLVSTILLFGILIFSAVRIYRARRPEVYQAQFVDD